MYFVGSVWVPYLLKLHVLGFRVSGWAGFSVGCTANKMDLGNKMHFSGLNPQAPLGFRL